MSICALWALPPDVRADQKNREAKKNLLPSEINCVDASIDFDNDPSLTPAENIALMDAALMRSLNMFDACQTKPPTALSARAGSNAAGGGEAGGADGNAPGSDGLVSGRGLINSVASSDMSGTKKPVLGNQQSVAGVSGWTKPTSGKYQASVGGDGTDPTDLVLNNGKLPEDIPSADNDSVLEAQIRKAAINEKDPEVQKRLWNEYRKYKGLPQVD